MHLASIRISIQGVSRCRLIVSIPPVKQPCLGCSDCASDQDAAQVREYFEMCLKAAEKQPSEDVIGVAALLPLCQAWVLPEHPVFRDSFQTKSYIHTILYLGVSRCNGKSYSSFPWFDGCKHERWEVLSFNPGVAVMSCFLAGGLRLQKKSVGHLT